MYTNYYIISNIVLDIFPQAREIKTKINKWDYIKLKCFCTVKVTINKMKRPPTKWEKIFANDISDKSLIFKIYKKTHIQLNSKKKNLILKLADLEDTQMANKHIKRCSTSLIIREMQKIIMRYHLPPVRMAIIKKATNNKYR